MQVRNGGEHLPVGLREHFHILLTMMRYLVEQGAEIQTCTRQARTLDEIFRELVQESGREVLQVAR